MRLNHFLFESAMDFDDRRVQQLVFENPGDLGRMVAELKSQIYGLEGSFVLFERSVDMGIKGVSLIVDPFSLEAGRREIVAGFTKALMSELVSPENHVKTDRLMSDLQSHILEIATDIEPSVDFQGLDLKGLVKAVGLGFQAGGDLVEDLCEYVRLAGRFAGTRLFVLVNMGAFLSDGRYLEMVRQLEYLQNPVLLVEGRVISVGCPVKVFDADFCEINLNSPS